MAKLLGSLDQICIFSSNLILNSSCLTKLIEVRDRKPDISSKQKKAKYNEEGSCFDPAFQNQSERCILAWHILCASNRGMTTLRTEVCSWWSKYKWCLWGGMSFCTDIACAENIFSYKNLRKSMGFDELVCLQTLLLFWTRRVLDSSLLFKAFLFRLPGCKSI